MEIYFSCHYIGANGIIRTTENNIQERITKRNETYDKTLDGT